LIKQWFAVRVKSRAEKKVSFLFREKSIEHYLPLQKKLRYWSDRRKLVDMPVIHGYAFVRITPPERLTVLQTPHVVNLVRFEGKDTVIPDIQIEAMKSMLGQSDYPVEVNYDELNPGQRVRIKSGVMKGLVAELITIHGKNRITLRITELNFNLMLDLPAQMLEVCP
jgi:transcription antitermination factor NusG